MATITIISTGRHKNNVIARNDEIVTRNHALFSNDIDKAQKASETLWQDIHGYFSRPCYTADHVFKIIEDGHINLKDEKSIKTLCALIEKSPALQEAILSLEPFSEEAFDSATQFDLGEDQEDIEAKSLLARNHFVRQLKENPFFAETLCRHAPTLVSRISNPDKLKSLLLSFPGMQSTLLATLCQEEQQDLAQQVLDRFETQNDVLSLFIRVPPGQVARNPDPIKESHIVAVMALLSQKESCFTTVKQLFTDLASCDDPTRLDAARLCFHNFIYADDRGLTKQLREQRQALFLAYPDVFSIACRKNNDMLIPLLEQTPNPMAFLNAMSSTESGQIVIHDKIIDVTLYLFEKYQHSLRQVDRFLLEKRAAFIEHISVDFPPNYEGSIMVALKEGMRRVKEGHDDYYKFIQDVCDLFAIPKLREFLPLNAETLLELMNFSAVHQATNRQETVLPFDPGLDKEIGLDSNLRKFLFEDPQFVNFAGTDNKAYPFTKAAKTLDEWYIAVGGLYAKLKQADLSLNAHQAYLAVTKPNYWRRVSPYRTLKVVLLRFLQFFAPTKFLKSKLEYAIHVSMKSDRLLHPVIALGIDFHAKSRKESFESYLLRNITSADDYHTDNPLETNEKKRQSYELWFSLASERQIFNLCNQKPEHYFIHQVLTSNKRYMQSYLSVLNSHDTIPEFALRADFMQACGKFNLHNDNLFESNNEAWSQYVRQALREDDLLFGLLERPNLDMLDLERIHTFDEIMALADDVDHPQWRRLSPMQLLNFYRVNPAQHRGVFERHYDEVHRVLDVPELLLDTLSEAVFRGAITNEQLFSTIHVPLKDHQLRQLAARPEIMWRILQLDFSQFSPQASENLNKIWFNSGYGSRLRQALKARQKPEAVVCLLQKNVPQLNALVVELLKDEQQAEDQVDINWILGVMASQECNDAVLSAMGQALLVLCREPRALVSVVRAHPECLHVRSRDVQTALKTAFSNSPDLVRDVVACMDASLHECKVAAYFEARPGLLQSCLTPSVDDQTLMKLFQSIKRPEVRQRLLSNPELIQRINPDLLLEDDASCIIRLIANGQADFYHKQERFYQRYFTQIVSAFHRSFDDNPNRVDFLRKLYDRRARGGHHPLNFDALGIVRPEQIYAMVRQNELPLSFFKQACPKTYQQFLAKYFRKMYDNGRAFDQQTMLDVFDAPQFGFSTLMQGWSKETLMGFLSDARFSSYGSFFKKILYTNARNFEGLFCKNQQTVPIERLFLKNAAFLFAVVNMSGKHRSPEQIGMSFETLMLLHCNARYQSVIDHLWAEFAKPHNGVPPFVIACYQAAPPAFQTRMFEKYQAAFGRRASRAVLEGRIAERLDLSEPLQMLRQAEFDDGFDRVDWSTVEITTEFKRPLEAISLLVHPHITRHLDVTQLEQVFYCAGINPHEYMALPELNTELEKVWDSLLERIPAVQHGSESDIQRGMVALDAGTGLAFLSEGQKKTTEEEVDEIASASGAGVGTGQNYSIMTQHMGRAPRSAHDSQRTEVERGAPSVDSSKSESVQSAHYDASGEAVAKKQQLPFLAEVLQGVNLKSPVIEDYPESIDTEEQQRRARRAALAGDETTDEDSYSSSASH